MKELTLSAITIALLSTSLYANNSTNIQISSATKSEQSIKDVTSNIEIITSSQLKNRNVKTLAQALQLVSGIDYTSTGGIGQSAIINVRGMSNNRVLVLIDGVSFQDPSNTVGASIHNVMINDIQRIEIIKGAQSGIWGANAAAGVINIITKESKKGFHGNLNLEAGSFNTKKVNLALSYKTDISDLKLSLVNINSDGFTARAPNGKDISNYEKDAYENTTVDYELGFKISDNSKISVTHKNIDGITQYDTSTNPNDSNMESDFNTKLSSLKSTTQFKKHKITALYSLSDFQREEIGTVGTQFGENVKIFNGTLKNIELKNTYKYKENSFINLGISQDETTVEYIDTANVSNDDKFSSTAIFLTNSHKYAGFIAGTSVFTQSIRYDKYKEFDNKATGKIGINHVHAYIKGLTTSLNYGTAYNTPNIIQILNPWGTSNHNLEAEDIKTIDVSINYKNLNVTYFENKIDNLIAWVGTGNTNIEGISKIKGYELSYKRALSTSLININYTNLNAKDKDGNTLSKQAKQTLKLSVDYFGIKRLNLNLNASYIGSRIENVYNVGEVQTGKYTIVNTNINYKINRKVNVYAKIDNITDKYYQTTYGYATSPRAYYMGINAKF